MNIGFTLGDPAPVYLAPQPYYGNPTPMDAQTAKVLIITIAICAVVGLTVWGITLYQTAQREKQRKAETPHLNITIPNLENND